MPSIVFSIRGLRSLSYRSVYKIWSPIEVREVTSWTKLDLPVSPYKFTFGYLNPINDKMEYSSIIINLGLKDKTVTIDSWGKVKVVKGIMETKPIVPGGDEVMFQSEFEFRTVR